LYLDAMYTGAAASPVVPEPFLGSLSCGSRIVGAALDATPAVENADLDMAVAAASDSPHGRTDVSLSDEERDVSIERVMRGAVTRVAHAVTVIIGLACVR
jgi:hypothetical protein